MTSPSEAGLSDRLRERVRRLGSTPTPASVLHFMDCIVPLLDEAATALDSLSARVKEADEACQRLCGAHGFATGHGDSAADMIDEISTQIGTLEERALRAEQQRDEAYERAAKICDAEFDRIISKQTPTDDPLSMADTVNTNIRMMACILPEVAAAIRHLASGPEDGSEGEK